MGFSNSKISIFKFCFKRAYFLRLLSSLNLHLPLFSSSQQIALSPLSASMLERSRTLFSCPHLSFPVLVCVCICVCTIPQGTCGLEDSFVELLFPTFMWAPEIQLKLAGFESCVLPAEPSCQSHIFLFVCLFLNFMYNQNLLGPVSLDCDFRTWEVGAEWSWVQGHPNLSSEFETSLWHITHPRARVHTHTLKQILYTEFDHVSYSFGLGLGSLYPHG